jgi:flavorubredoxin
MTNSREILPDVYWLYEEGPDRSGMIEAIEPIPDWYEPDDPVHIPQCAYLIVGDEHSLLFDTLSPASTEHVLAELDALLDAPLDYLVVSHPDVPHAGNTPAILAEHGSELVAPRYGDDHELYRLDEALLVGEGDSLDLGGYVVDFHEATFLDAPVSLWMSERTEEMLFPVDWLGFPHHASEQLRFVDELEHDLDGTRLLQFHGRVLFWHQYVDVDKVQREIDRLKDRYDPEWILPSHGLVIRDDAPAYMDQLKGVVEEIERQERIGILG